MWFLLGFVVGLIFGILIYRLYKIFKPEGVMEYDDSDESKDKYNLVVLVPTDEFKSRKLITFKTKRVLFKPFNEEV